MRWFVLHASALAGALVLGACDRQPTGQVAAILGDDEITLQEVNAEIGNANLPKGADAKAAQQNALQRIIERRLLASVARDQDLDKKPDFLIRKRQLEDGLLVQLLGDQARRSVRVPDAVAVDKFVAAHPETFAGREILLLDQIRFAMPADPTQLRNFESDHSLDAIAAKLDKLGTKYQRGGASLDTAGVAPEALAQIKSLPPGEPFMVPQGNLVTASAIVGRNSVPLIGEAARPMAVQMMRNEQLTKVFKERLAAKKAETEVEYQLGFAPTKAAKSPTRAAAGG